MVFTSELSIQHKSISFCFGVKMSTYHDIHHLTMYRVCIGVTDFTVLVVVLIYSRGIHDSLYI